MAPGTFFTEHSTKSLDSLQRGAIIDSALTLAFPAGCIACRVYRGTSLIRSTHPPRITIGPSAKGYGGSFLMSEVPL